MRTPAPDNSRDHNGLRVMVLPDGTRLNGYQLCFEAVGGMAVAYRGKTAQGRSFLLKEAALINVRGIAALHQERAMLEKLDHPGIVKFQGYFEAGGHAYLVRDYVEGTGLDQQVSPFGDIFLTEELVRDWGLQLCDILGYLHRQSPPIVYRDLKPKNVMRDAQNRLFLIDFGIARSFKEGQQQDTELLGSALTASPEHYGGQTDARSDLYTLAATLHHLLTNGQGERTSPFDFPSVRSVNPGVSEGMDLLLQRCLQKDPARRFQTAEEFAAALQGDPETTVALPPADRPVEPARVAVPRNSGGLQQAVLLVLGVAFGVLLTSLLSSREPARESGPGALVATGRPPLRPGVVEVSPTGVALIAAPLATPSAVVRPVPSSTPTSSTAVAVRVPRPPAEPVAGVEPAPRAAPPVRPVARPTVEPVAAVPVARPTVEPVAVPTAAAPVTRPTVEPGAPVASSAQGVQQQPLSDPTTVLQSLGLPAAGLGPGKSGWDGDWERRAFVDHGFAVPAGWWAQRLDEGNWLLASQRVLQRSTQLIRVRSLAPTKASSELLAQAREQTFPRRVVLERRTVGEWHALVLEGARGRLRVEEVFVPLPQGVVVVSGMSAPQGWDSFQGEFERLVAGWRP